MARISRFFVPKYPHHVTRRGARSMAIFQTDEDRRAYLQFLAEEAGLFGVEILVWCLTPTHQFGLDNQGYFEKKFPLTMCLPGVKFINNWPPVANWCANQPLIF